MSASTRRKLAVNLIQLMPNQSGGIETYARELIPKLVDQLPDWQITVFVNTEGFEHYRAWDDRCEWRHVELSWFDRFRRLTYESTVLPRMLRAGKFDLLHNMVNTACFKPGCPQVTTIFDATPQLYPEPGESLPSKVFRRLLARSVRRSDAIVTISESAASDLVRAYGLASDDVNVVLLAARPPQEPLDGAAVLGLIGLPPDARYFITPAARRPHKNIDRLVRSFAKLQNPGDTHLLLPGADAGKDVQLTRLIAEVGIEERVHLLGWITDQQLDTLYANAVALVFPSLAEGFGLPILEAMQCGCPVATSNVSSMPEVGGDAAIYFDPTRESEIVAAMERLLHESALRDRLATAGRSRAQMFSWDRTARQTAAVYGVALDG